MIGCSCFRPRRRSGAVVTELAWLVSLLMIFLVFMGIGEFLTVLRLLHLL